MRPNHIKDTIKSLNPLQIAVCIEGAVGVGKSSIVKTVAKELDVHCILRNMATMLVEDFGIPSISDDTVKYKLIDWYPAKGSKWDDGRGGILCFDDRNQAGTDQQKLLAHLIQERDLHGVPMADGWQVISTGNRQSDRAGANRVLSHLRNREALINYDFHLDDWTGWALENGVNPIVVSFLRFKPDLAAAHDPSKDVSPTIRGWTERISPAVGIIPSDCEFEYFTGVVGESAAAYFTTYLKLYRKLPNVDALLLNPSNYDVPTDLGVLHALSGAIAHRASTSNFDRICSFAERMPPEFSVLTISYATRKNPELANTSAFTNWAVKHQDVLF